ncbi:MAG: PCMD domain-containing protein [Muribaculaceae bacterium]|nr:PCMD domain-containing protein [Muribaculaceae bacterium]
MKNIFKYGYTAAGLLLLSAAMQSCAVEEPFGSGEGVLQMKLVINSDVTRAAMSQEDLSANCVVYISGEKGLVFKERGLNNLPDQIALREGKYIAEAWTGDSVPASFDSKFYYGNKGFDMVAGSDNELELVCKIANVVASIGANTVDDTQIKNLHVTVSTSNGSLEFTPENYKTAKGYFMMPFKDGVRESTLKVKVEGENILGEPFVKEKTVENVKPTHEYVVKLSYNSDEEEPQGGGFVSISIDERENLVADTVEIFAAPAIDGVDFDIDKQIVGNPGEFSGDKVVKVVAFDEITSFTIECIDAGNLNLPAQAVDLKKCDDATIAQLHAAGITWDKTVEDLSDNKDGHKRQLSYITFSEQYLNSLPARATEYRIILTATDGTGNDLMPGKTTAKTLRIAVGEEAIVYDDPLIVEDVATSGNYMAIGARQASLNVSVKDETATGLGIMYRERGSSDWTKVPVTLSRAATAGSVVLTNLKPATTYEYKAYADDFEATDVMNFTTEGIFEIPNASMEDWSDYSSNSKVLLPGPGGERTFWDSGNHGSATMSVTLTQGSEDMKHSGSKSARLRSQFVGLGGFAGKFAAGNLFAGTYVKTDGTDGVLEFGRPYNGSHPDKLRLYVNYRPGTVEKGGDKIANGSEDEGQIYVALTTAPVEVRTKKSNQKLFDPNGDEVIAYGQYSFEGAYGPDGQLQMLEIPIEYYSKARNVKPTHLVIVCSASKYGDFFQGGEGSLMYLDDFELVYE